MEKEEDENTRLRLDQEFNSILGLLYDEVGVSTTGSNSVPLGRARPIPTQDSPTVEQGDQEYDQYVRELAFDKRAKPKDRTKTEEELALEEKEALEKAERARVRRMMGVEDDSDDDEEGRKGRKRKRERDDDSEDDFDEDEENVLAGIGAGLVSEYEKEHEDEDEDEGVSGPDNEEDATDSTDETQKSLEGGDELDPDNGGDATTDVLPIVPFRKRDKMRRKPAEGQDLPFTYPCPVSHEEFLTILENIDDGDVPTVIHRIRSLHHPSLSKDNPARLQVLSIYYYYWYYLD